MCSPSKISQLINVTCRTCERKEKDIYNCFYKRKKILDCSMKRKTSKKKSQYGGNICFKALADRFRLKPKLNRHVGDQQSCFCLTLCQMDFMKR